MLFIIFIQRSGQLSHQPNRVVQIKILNNDLINITDKHYSFEEFSDYAF